MTGVPTALRIAHHVRPLEQQPAMQPRKIHPETGLTSWRSLVASAKQAITDIREQIPSGKALKEKYPCRNKGNRMAEHMAKVKGKFPPVEVRLDASYQRSEEEAKEVSAATVSTSHAVDLASAQAFQHPSDSVPATNLQAVNARESLKLLQPSRRSKRPRFCPRYALPTPSPSQDPDHPGLIHRIGTARELHAIKRSRKAQQDQEIRTNTYGYLPLGSSEASLRDEEEEFYRVEIVCVGDVLLQTRSVRACRAFVELMLAIHTDDDSEWGKEEGEGESEGSEGSEVSGPVGFWGIGRVGVREGGRVGTGSLFGPWESDVYGVIYEQQMLETL